MTPVMYKGTLHKTALSLAKAKTRAKLADIKTTGKSKKQKLADLSETARRRTGSAQVLKAHERAAAEELKRKSNG